LCVYPIGKSASNPKTYKGGHKKPTMRITDYEAGRHLNDVAICLTRDEAEELSTYLHALLNRPEGQRAHLTELTGVRMERELTIEVRASA
jgi:hypothetical protein